MTLQEHFEDAWRSIYPDGPPFPRGKEVAAVFFCAGVAATVGREDAFALGQEMMGMVQKYRRGNGTT